jgi:hypothetical protein
MTTKRSIVFSFLLLFILITMVFNTPNANAARSDVEAFVTRFYQIILNREPDAVGLNGWVNDLVEKKLTGSRIKPALPAGWIN